MDINFTPIVSGTIQGYNPPVTQQTANQNPVPVTPRQPPQQPDEVTAANNNSAPSIQAQYEDAVRQAALSFKNSYPLGDTEFSFFKDATGQLITRYVSLIDGSVTYVPAPVFVRNMNNIISPPIMA